MAKNAATEAALGGLHEALATVLTTAVKSEGAPAAILAVAAKFLKDNDITCAPSDENKVGELKEALAKHEAPADPESDAVLAQALEGVTSLDAYRNGVR